MTVKFAVLENRECPSGPRLVANVFYVVHQFNS